MAVPGSPGKHHNIFWPVLVLLTLTVSILVRGSEVYFFSRSILLISNLSDHAEGARVNYLLGPVLLTVTVPGGTEKVLDIYSFVAWVARRQGI